MSSSTQHYTYSLRWPPRFMWQILLASAIALSLLGTFWYFNWESFWNPNEPNPCAEFYLEHPNDFCDYRSLTSMEPLIISMAFVLVTIAFNALAFVRIEEKGAQ